MKHNHTMKNQRSLILAVTLLLAVHPVGAQSNDQPPSFQPRIPKVWDDAAMASLELPLADRMATPKQVAAEYYYRIPVRPIFASYPVYHPDREPPGYFEKLQMREPILLWDDKGVRPALKTEADWLSAGKIVFESALGTDTGRISASTATNLFVREARWYREVEAPVTSEGILPFYRYVIRERGKVEVGALSCAMCHTRVMQDGSTIVGAQGNLPFGAAYANGLREKGNLLEVNRLLEQNLYAAPWIQPDILARLNRLSVDQLALPHGLIPPGVLARHRASPLSPVQVPDLIGLKDRRYLDRTGLQRHRDIADLMRYAALNQGADGLANFAGFVPAAAFSGTMPKAEDDSMGRYSDEQLYALSLFAYSLKPPPNPNLPKAESEKALVQRGEAIFRDTANRCTTCHDPKQGYTNHKLIAAPGYDPPADHPANDDIMRTLSGAPRRVGTDPTLTLTTRRGTGFYKVPSLLGVWYRGPFEHNGSCATLEDWFDPRRQDADYIPTGWKGPPGTKTRAVTGHDFGLDLAEDERKALIAFLKTL